MWWLHNHNNPKYLFLWGNHELRFALELQKYIKEQRKEEFHINDVSSDIWFSKNKNINISNVAIELIEKNVISTKNILEAFVSLKWFHVENINGITYKFSHASWDITKSDNKQSKKNLVYDTEHLLVETTKKDPSPKMKNYIELCKEKKIKHVIGHFPTPKVFKVPAPYIYLETFYYIDAGWFQRANDPYFMKL